MRAIVLDGHGLRVVMLPTAMLLAMAALFVIVAVARLRFDETKVGWA
jgi:hypothetical protein